MYYPNLMNMKQDHWVRKRDVKLLDEWLIKTPYRNRKNINFLKFSVDEDISEELALRLFIKATDKKVKVLNLYYNVVTDDKMHHLGKYSSVKAIPEFIHDYNSGRDIVVNESNIEVKFEIIDFPETLSLKENKSSKKKDIRFPTMEDIQSYMNHEEMIKLFK